MKAFAIATLISGTVLLGPIASWGTILTKTCLTGTDPAVNGDFMQLNALRPSVDSACPCSAYDGSPGLTHAAYVRCANSVIHDRAVPPGTIRSQCVQTAKKYYAQSTCGRNPAVHYQPCIRKAIKSGAVSCSIKPTTKADGATPSTQCRSGRLATLTSCAGFTECLDAADSKGDLRIGAGDSGACVTPIGGTRPVAVHVPPSYTPRTAMPLVVMLHGYSASGDIEESYLALKAQADLRGFLYVHPDGTIDGFHNRFWNATDACCNFFASPVDDSAYITGVISDVAARYNVDPKRIYIVGHSNGAFMAHRMACEHADTIAAIVSLAGAMYEDATVCTPSNPVSVLQIHGTADSTIAYGGGAINGHPFPGALVTVGDWVALDACTNTADTSLPPLDLDNSLAGAETTIERYAAGCTAGSDVELWTIQGGGHVPILSSHFTPDLVDFLLAHPKP